MRKKKHKTRPIITEYLESISSKVFKDEYYKKAVTKMIKGGQGIYALYKNDSLYYVGLAIEFKRRIKQHLKDKHAGRWNKFSLFMIRKEEHIRELESLIVHVAKPNGNSQNGKFGNAKNLISELTNTVDELYWEHQSILLGLRAKKTKANGKKKVKAIIKSIANAERPLKGLFPRGKVIYANYKGKEYKAWVNRIGRIRVNGKHFDSPSSAGGAVVGRNCVDGWFFWKYKNNKGELVDINELRK
jgi:hypothetical protein